MKTILKFEIRTEAPSVQRIEMHAGAIPLFVAVQFPTMYLWAEVETGYGTQRKTFHVYKAGQSMPRVALKYVGSALWASDAFHVYEQIGHDTVVHSRAAHEEVVSL